MSEKLGFPSFFSVLLKEKEQEKLVKEEDEVSFREGVVGFCASKNLLLLT